MSQRLVTKKEFRREAYLARRALGRNDAFYDIWSLVHFLTGVLLGWIMAPFIALIIMIVWEPLEILVLSPILGRFHIHFGYETLRNSLSDIIVDAAGVAAGSYLLLHLVAPPLHLFR